jgi:V/A-type H+-transporting ATPase subunit C
LTDTTYGRFLGGEHNRGLSSALDAAAAENMAFFQEHCLDEWLLDLYRLRIDAHNLKTAVKRHLSGVELSAGDVQGNGRWSREQLLAFVSGERSAGPEAVADTVRQAIRRYGDDRDPAGVDTAIDKLVQVMALELAQPSDFVSGYYRLHADVENLRTLVRVKLLPGGKEGRGSAILLTDSLLIGGTLTPGILSSLLQGEWDMLVSHFAMSPFRQYVEEGTTAAVRAMSMLKMERLGREQELHYLKQSRYATFGHEPLATFFLMHENELRNLRQLYAAKQASLTEEDTRELVAYVD